MRILKVLYFFFALFAAIALGVNFFLQLRIEPDLASARRARSRWQLGIIDVLVTMLLVSVFLAVARVQFKTWVEQLTWREMSGVLLPVLIHVALASPLVI